MIIGLSENAKWGTKSTEKMKSDEPANAGLEQFENPEECPVKK
jgi:hypothetical protein